MPLWVLVISLMSQFSGELSLGQRIEAERAKAEKAELRSRHGGDAVDKFKEMNTL